MTVAAPERVTSDHRAMHLPASPLLSTIRRRGGLMSLFPTVEKRRGGVNGDGHKSGTVQRVVAPEARKDYDRVLRSLDRASESGRITLAAADDVCCRLLNAHPSDVFGGAYWDLP